MKCKDLIEQLQQFDPEVIVLHSKDGEGNKYVDLGYVELESFQSDESEFYCVAEEDKIEYEQDELTIAVALYPVW